ncbi:MAG: hypothetical protein H0T97_05180 [Actinobacteria bacterium]|nr:hypothetical protein [Actinomycetota bacterium]
MSEGSAGAGVPRHPPEGRPELVGRVEPGARRRDARRGLDAFLGWAEKWTALDPPLKAPGGWPPKLSGRAALWCREAGAPKSGRIVLKTFLGTEDKPRDQDGVLAALEALCAEADRLYGAG